MNRRTLRSILCCCRFIVWYYLILRRIPTLLYIIKPVSPELFQYYNSVNNLSIYATDDIPNVINPPTDHFEVGAPTTNEINMYKWVRIPNLLKTSITGTPRIIAIVSMIIYLCYWRYIKPPYATYWPEYEAVWDTHNWKQSTKYGILYLIAY